MKHVCILITLSLIASAVLAQKPDKSLTENSFFKGAKPTEKVYRAIYQLDESDPKVIEKTIRNINNVLEDPRLKGRLKIELVAYSGGTDAFLKSGKYEDALKGLVQKGVIVAQCHNTLIERNMSRDDIYDFIAVVPTGNGELILRQTEGWAIVKP